MQLGDRSVRALMTPRPEVDWIDLDQEPSAILERLRASPHSRQPAARGAIDAAIGVLHAKDVLHQVTSGGDVTDLAALVRAAPTVHDSADALDALEALRRLTGRHGVRGRRARHLRGPRHRGRSAGSDRRPVCDP